MKANELINMTPNFWGKGNKAVDLIDLKTAKEMCVYASVNWKACFSKEEIREYSYCILWDKDTLKTYLENLTEDIKYNPYNLEAIDLYNRGNAILKAM